MLREYIQQALEQATYEIIEDDDPYYAEVPALQGVWATGGSLEECRRNLIEAVEDWLFLSITKGLPNRQDIGVSLLTRLLNQAGISREEWETEE